MRVAVRGAEVGAVAADLTKGRAARNGGTVAGAGQPGCQSRRPPVGPDFVVDTQGQTWGNYWDSEDWHEWYEIRAQRPF
ncbi:hypothetical protein AB0R12_19015, partial [Streptomyces niveus]|uniref:hypothetical protein n=1 Tax=Streptomyces niveus TaxID=193462 RepID=UPI003426BECE